MTTLMTTQEACEKYGISKTTLWRWVAKGKITQYKNPVSNRCFYEQNVKNALTVSEVCYILGFSRMTLHRYVLKDLIRPMLNDNTKFTQEEIERFKKAQRNSLIITPSVNDILGKVEYES